MMVSTKGRYALRFLVDVAEHQGDGFVPLKDVAASRAYVATYAFCLLVAVPPFEV